MNEHLADGSAVAFDLKEAGSKLRGATIVFVVIALAAIGAAAYFATNMRRSSEETIAIAVGAMAFLFTFIAITLVVVDLRMPLRNVPTPPEETLKHFFKAIALGRLGYAWAALCPTAREQTVETPVLGPIPVSYHSFTLRRTEDVKSYTQTFARPGDGHMRTMQIKRAVLISEEGDVAVVEVTAYFQAWPQWAQIVSIVAFVLSRALGGILFLALYLALRKTHEVTFRKTMIRGNNGVWYVYSGDLLEGAGQNS